MLTDEEFLDLKMYCINEIMNLREEKWFIFDKFKELTNMENKGDNFTELISSLPRNIQREMFKCMQEHNPELKSKVVRTMSQLDHKVDHLIY